MPIRITCRNKWPDGQQVVERRVFSTLRQEIGRLSYTDNIQDYCILCGSI